MAPEPTRPSLRGRREGTGRRVRVVLAIRGVLEGFYGRPWTWDERVEVARWCGARGLTHYVWAPKDDPLHREAWREPWPEAHLAGFARLVAAGDLALGVADPMGSVDGEAPELDQHVGGPAHAPASPAAGSRRHSRSPVIASVSL